MKRFQHYINSEEMDSSLSFIKEREQRFPKPSVNTDQEAERNQALNSTEQIEITEVS